MNRPSHSIRNTRAAAGVLAFLLIAGCRGTSARSNQSFDEIRGSVEGKTAQEVVELLGEPDTRQSVFEADERWIWWNYTFLDGNDHPPELRGRVVHLEIVFSSPTRLSEMRRPYSEWRVAEGFGVSFKMPSNANEGVIQ